MNPLLLRRGFTQNIVLFSSKDIKIYIKNKVPSAAICVWRFKGQNGFSLKVKTKCNIVNFLKDA